MTESMAEDFLKRKPPMPEHSSQRHLVKTRDRVVRVLDDFVLATLGIYRHPRKLGRVG